MSKPRRAIVLAEPPREVPTKARLAALFGGPLAQVGWGLMLCGLLFAAVFTLDSEVVTWLEFRGPLAATQGEVMSVHETSASENKRRIHRIHFRYPIEGGGTHEADSYAVSPALEPGESVRVEYVVRRPERARIEGLRAHTFGAGTAFVVIFPFVGLVMALTQLPTGFRRRRLLRIGRIAYGKLVEKKDTGTRVNKRPVYALTFELTVPRETGLFGYRTAPPAEEEVHRITHKTADTGELEDDAEEPFLYDPANPSCAYPLDGLPGRVTVGPDGQIDASRARLWPIVLPLLATVGWGLLLLGALGKLG